MGIATGLTAERMLEIEANSITGGMIDIHGDLILTTHGGETINAGQVEPTRFMTVTDSSSVDLGITGAGSLALPWNLTASVKVIDASKVTSGVLGLDRIPNLTAEGLLEATYRGGKAKVKVGGVWSTNALSWATPYDPSKSRAVRLMKVGVDWMIMGQIEDNDIRLELNPSTVAMYSEVNTDMLFAYEPRAIKLPSGLVMLSGLLRSPAAYSGSEVLATLPEGFRPDHDAVWAVEWANQARAITIFPNGEIKPRTNFTGGNYISLDGIAFWAAGVPTWTPIGQGGSSFGANFDTDAGWNNYGPAAFWKDPYGFVWFKGLIRNIPAMSVDNTVSVNLPATHRPYKQMHFRTTANDVFGFIGGAPASGLAWKNGGEASAGSWHSLDSVVLVTAEARANNPWKDVACWNNGWSNYLVSTFPAASYLMREDGLRIAEGLIGSGTIGQRPFILHEKEMWPDTGRKILARVSNAARGRADIYSSNAGDADIGAFYASQGTSAWFSLDGAMWYP